MDKKSIKILFLATFAVLWLALFTALQVADQNEIEDYLEQKTTQYTQDYDIIYNSYRKLANTIYATYINTDEIKIIFKEASLTTGEERDAKRLKLYNRLKGTYLHLKKDHIKQLHFHLPDNESFLRMHRPDKYGDNLTGIRPTVEYVNKNKEFIDGFEEGRVYNGYRFVYPLFYDGEYLGSVEISYATIVMSFDFINTLKVFAHFLIFKDIVEKKVFDDEKSNYTQSPLDDLYIEKRFIKMVSDKGGAYTKKKLSPQTIDIINKNGLNRDNFSLYDDYIKNIITLIKIKNPVNEKVVGIFVVRSSADFINSQNKNFMIDLLLSSLLLAIVLLFVYQELQKRINLKQLNKTLEQRVKEEVDKNRQKDKQLLAQSRLAQMGEMLSMIAHQWRQPLAAISATSAVLELKAELGRVDEETVIKQSKKISQYSQHLSRTIDDFRDFFKPSKELKESSYNEIIESVLDIVGTSIENKNITIIQKLSTEYRFLTYPNELKQVILNILKNAEDILLEKNIKDPKIKIITYTKEGGNVLEIHDNAGGVSTEIIEKIFDPYFSTKLEKNGTGLGLYMSKTIIEDHCSGILSVSNDEYGAVFKIELETAKE